MSAEIGIRITGDSKDFEAALARSGATVDAFGRKAGEGLGGIAPKTQQATAAATGLRETLISFAVGGTILGAFSVLAGKAGEVAGALLEAQIQADRLGNSLKFTFGQAGAARETAYLRDVTRELGQEYLTSAQSYGKLAAAARGTNLEGKGTRDIFEAIAGASTVMGLSVEQSNGALQAITQIISKGTVQSEELRGQLGERLPGAFQIAARAMGVTTAELGKMLEQGEVISEEFIPKFSAQLKKELGDSTVESANSAQAAVNNLSSSWGLAKEELAKAGLGEFIKGQLNILTDGFDNFSQAIRQSSEEGDGFIGIWAAGGGALLEFLNPLNAVSFGASSTAGQLAQAKERLAELQKSLETPSAYNVTFLRPAIKETEELIARLEDAKRKQQELSAGPAAYGDEQAFASYTRELEQRAKREAAAGAFLKKYATDAEKLAAELRKAKTELGEFFSPDIERRIRASFNKKNLSEPFIAGRDAAKAYADAVGDFQKIQASAEGKTNDLSKAQERLVEYLKSAVYAQHSESMREVVLQAAFAAINAEQAADAYKDFNKALAESDAARLKGLIAGDEANEKLEEQNKALREEIELIGLSEVQQFAVIRARNESTIALKEERLARLQALDIGREEQVQLAEEIRQLKERNQLQGVKVDRTAAASALEELNAEAKRFYGDIERGLTDSLFRAFEAGRGFFSTLWDGIKNLFKTTVLKLVIQGVVGGVGGIFGVGSALADDGTGGGAGGIIQAANTLKKVYESFTNGSAASIISAFGTGGFSGSAAGYSEIANQFAGALADAGFYDTAGLIADNAAILSQGAAVVGAALSAYSIVAAFDAGEYGKAIGTAIGYYFFGDLGGAIGGYLGGVVDSFFGGGGDNRGGDTHGGGVYSSNGGFLTNDAQVGAIFNLRGEAIKDLTDRADAQVSVLVGALAVSLQNAAANVDRILGTKALQEITLGLAIDLKGYGKDVLGYFNLVGADGERVNYANRDLSSNPQEAFKELSDAAAQAIVDGLRGADIPAYARDIFSGIEAEAEAAKETLAGTEFLQEFITKLQEAEQFSKTLQGLPIDSLNSISIEAAQSLAKLSGGIETLTSNLEGYLTNFYSEAELQVSALANVRDAFKQLDAAGAFAQTAEEFQRLLIDPTRANFRALVEAQDVNTEAGQRTYAALLALSGAVASVVPAADSAADALASLFGAVNDNAGIRAATEAEATAAADRRDVIAGRRAIEEANALQAQESATAATEAATAAASARANAEQALRQAYEAEIQALDAIIAARDTAVQVLEQAYQREAGVLRQAADGFGELAQSLRAFVSDLNGIADTPEQSTARLRARFNATIAAALGGDADAARNIPGAGRDYVDAASLTAATRVDMLREIARVQVATEGVIDFAEAQKTIAEQQLEALNQQVSGLLTVDQSVLSVAEAIAALQTATVAAIDAESQKAILTAQVSSLITVNESVLSVRDAIVALENTQKQIAGIATGGVGRTKGGVSYTENIAFAGGEPGSEVLGTATQLGRLERIAAQNPGRADLADQVANLLRTADQSLAIYPELLQAFESVRQLQRNATAQSILAANPVAEYDPALRSYYGSQYGINLGPIGSVPGFATGGEHSGGWRMVGETGRELEYTPPSRIFSNSQTNALMDNSGVEQRLERVENALMVGMATIAKNTADVARIVNRWEGDGLPETRDTEGTTVVIGV